MNGTRHGQGIAFSRDGTKKEYEGEWMNGTRHGQGIEFYRDGTTK